MGKTKEYTEHEHGAINPYTNSTTTRSTGRRTRTPQHPSRGDFGAEVPPIPVLFQLIWVRLRRAWISLRYRGHRVTGGTLQHYGLAKIGVLAAFGYWVFVAGLPATSSSSSGDAEGASIFDGIAGGGKARKAKYSTTNEAAPVSASELFAQEAQDYIGKYAEVAQREQAKYGVPASISLAQGLIESRAGTSKLAKNNNNHFGIKCFSRNCKKGHCSNFTDDTHKDFFRKFANPWDSWRAHSEMLSRGRYKSLHKYGTDYRQWAYGLKRLGYATDPDYDKKLISTVEKFDLARFD
jgi:hypothetical protein